MFVALPVPSPSSFTAVLHQLRDRGARHVPPDRLHMTLIFMAAVAEGLVPGVEAAVEEAARGQEAFAIATTGRVGRFGRGVAWAEVAAPIAVHQLFSSLAGELSQAGIAVDQRPYRPHITLARAGREAIRADTTQGLQAPVLEWTVNEMFLIESRLGDGPARWRTVLAATLGTSGETRGGA